MWGKALKKRCEKRFVAVSERCQSAVRVVVADTKAVTDLGA
jgi:hypothetical protein